ncbi:hypothetical protein L1887_07595 [Cichorium endivia]|nr:hypothetical protein L1887_07595 [Cichorium endivia]
MDLSLPSFSKVSRHLLESRTGISTVPASLTRLLLRLHLGFHLRPIYDFITNCDSIVLATSDDFKFRISDIRLESATYEDDLAIASVLCDDRWGLTKLPIPSTESLHQSQRCDEDPTPGGVPSDGWYVASKACISLSGEKKRSPGVRVQPPHPPLPLLRTFHFANRLYDVIINIV